MLIIRLERLDNLAILCFNKFNKVKPDIEYNYLLLIVACVAIMCQFNYNWLHVYVYGSGGALHYVK